MDVKIYIRSLPSAGPYLFLFGLPLETCVCLLNVISVSGALNTSVRSLR